jgi:hypothetical protein
LAADDEGTFLLQFPVRGALHAARMAGWIAEVEVTNRRELAVAIDEKLRLAMGGSDEEAK